MAEAPPSFLADAVAARPEDNTDKLAELKRGVQKARDMTQEKADLESRLKETNIALEEMKRKTLPDLLASAGVPSIEIEAEGNQPGFRVDLKDDYYANIPADWPEDQRKAAFAYLTSLGEGDLIKTEVITSFGREDRESALAFANELSREGKSVALKEAIPFQTLTAWLKNKAEKHAKDPAKNPLPDLDKINGKIGKIVVIKPLKEK